MATAFVQPAMGLRGPVFASHPKVQPVAQASKGAFAVASTTKTSASDMAALKDVIESAQKGKDGYADKRKSDIKDPVAQKLAEYVILRSHSTNPSFQRYDNFINENPNWPHVSLLGRRAENALWNDGIEDAAVLGFFAHRQPTTAKGRYVLAHALLAKGDKDGATALVRYAWRYQDSSDAVENKVIEMFGKMLTADDHKVRMAQRFYEQDTEAGMRAAKRLGGGDLAIAHAWTAVIKRARNAKARLDAVPTSARNDPGYIFARARWLRRNDKHDEAAKLILSAPNKASPLIESNEWWRERRVLVRDLLDKKDPKTAYRIAVEAVTPSRNIYRVDKYFTAGWIALRFLDDAKAAAALFERIPQGTNNPHALSRGRYWQGRAAEALGQKQKAEAFYKEGAKHTITYYGQLARARLGLPDLGLRGPPKFTDEQRAAFGKFEVVRAAELLYALNERDMIASMYAELGQSGRDVAGMTALAELAGKQVDPRAMLLLCESAVRRGLPLDYHAYPVAGLPDFKPIAPPVGRALAYAIARQESHFHQKVVSSAHAMGLMQVTPAAGKDTAKRFKVRYDRRRLLTDPVYNMQMGTGELAHLLKYLNGNYLLTASSYNAGLGRTRQWMEIYGDPRDPKIDPVDWAERLPYSETRNYVQRILENLAVYRARFAGNDKLMIEADLTRGGK
jgi:soluble lytic murein transglycosylase